MLYPILNSEDLRNISRAIADGKEEILISLDLGFSGKKEKLGLFEKGIIFDQKEIELPKIREDDKSCYLIIEDILEKVQYSSGSIYKLIPTKFRPILQISGTSMHKQAFIERVERDNLTGKILDSGTGLGYTAVTAAKTATKVKTIEVDEMVLEIQKINPYSQELFNNKKIELVQGDLVEEITSFLDEEFDFVILDGGTPKSSGEFFSTKNYEQVFRVLKRRGRLYHYIPNYHINKGTDFAENISKTLKKIGFSKIERDLEGSYIIASK